MSRAICAFRSLHKHDDVAISCQMAKEFGMKSGLGLARLVNFDVVVTLSELSPKT